MDAPAGKRRHVDEGMGPLMAAAHPDAFTLIDRSASVAAACVRPAPQSPRRRPGAHHPRLRRASGAHRTDGVGKPLALALFAPLAGNLTFAEGIDLPSSPAHPGLFFLGFQLGAEMAPAINCSYACRTRDSAPEPAPQPAPQLAPGSSQLGSHFESQLGSRLRACSRLVSGTSPLLHPFRRAAPAPPPSFPSPRSQPVA
jgi:hypothetical protein